MADSPPRDIERLELLRTAEALERYAPNLRARFDELELVEGLALPRCASAEPWPEEPYLAVIEDTTEDATEDATED